jgi:hypothetical protein
MLSWLPPDCQFNIYHVLEDKDSFYYVCGLIIYGLLSFAVFVEIGSYIAKKKEVKKPTFILLILLQLFSMMRIGNFLLYAYESSTRTIPYDIDLAYTLLFNCGLSLLAVTYLAVLYTWHYIALRIKHISPQNDAEFGTSKIILLVQISIFTPVSFTLAFFSSYYDNNRYSNPARFVWIATIALFMMINGVWSIWKIIKLRNQLVELDDKTAKFMKKKNIIFGIASMLCLISSFLLPALTAVGAYATEADPWTFLGWSGLFKLLEAIAAWLFFLISEKYWGKLKDSFVEKHFTMFSDKRRGTELSYPLMESGSTQNTQNTLQQTQ